MGRSVWGRKWIFFKNIHFWVVVRRNALFAVHRSVPRAVEYKGVRSRFELDVRRGAIYGIFTSSPRTLVLETSSSSSSSPSSI
nr:hypothetical protein Itr_chr04CG11000 [Ipomoea trifida]